MADQVKGFVSYSHKDEKLYEELMKHLKTLKDLAIFWSDQKIMPGEKWDEAILEEVKTAHVILLLISIDFINSNYIETVEVQEAMERDSRGEACVIPIILRKTNWKGQPYYKLKALPKDGKPLTLWNDRDTAFTAVVEGIEEAIKKLIGTQNDFVGLSEKKRRADRFHDALLDLDYDDQIDTFNQFIAIENRAHIGAFVIHGESYYGQNWLINRLINNTGIENVGKEQFKFSFTRNTVGIELEELWDDIGRWLDSSHPLDSPALIVEQVYKLWLRQSVVLKIGSIERATEEYIREFFHTFWEPLVEMIEQNRTARTTNYLLLFLTDNDGSTENWNYGWRDWFDTPTIPVKLKKIREFTPEDIELWIKSHKNKLPPELTLQKAMTKGGVPEIAFGHICKICGYRWYNQEGVRL